MAAKTYNGRPCPLDGTVRKYVQSRHCVACAKARAAEQYAKERKAKAKAPGFLD